MQSLMKVSLVIYIKHKGNSPALTTLQKQIAIDCLVSELSKLRFRAHNLFDGLLKRLRKCIIDETGVWWCNR